MNKEIIKKEQSNNFIYYSLRISFCIMILCWILAIFITSIEGDTYFSLFDSFIYLIWVSSIIFCFVTSIIHLKKYNKKGFAITSLVISSILIFVIFIGFIIGFVIETVNTP